YICSCGTNITETAGVERLIAETGAMKDVEVAKTHSLLCSEEGKQFLENEIRANGLDRIVVAACSPSRLKETSSGLSTRSAWKLRTRMLFHMNARRRFNPAST
ncbi:MAG: hypothetical protein WCX65_19535, partial [bacterium]